MDEKDRDMKPTGFDVDHMNMVNSRLNQLQTLLSALSGLSAALMVGAVSILAKYGPGLNQEMVSKEFIAGAIGVVLLWGHLFGIYQSLAVYRCVLILGCVFRRCRPCNSAKAATPRIGRRRIASSTSGGRFDQGNMAFLLVDHGVPPSFPTVLDRSSWVSGTKFFVLRLDSPLRTMR